jgi:hypothetical protein
MQMGGHAGEAAHAERLGTDPLGLVSPASRDPAVRAQLSRLRAGGGAGRPFLLLCVAAATPRLRAWLVRLLACHGRHGLLA